MKAVIYARYSSDKQTEQSIEGQMRVCKDFAKRNGYKLVGEYIDRAISGKSASKRPNFLQMIGDAESGKFEHIIVYKLDRFSRNRYDSVVFKQKLKECGVKVKSATEQISDSAEGMLVEGLLETMAELYSHDLSQKVRRGMKESFLKGHHSGGNVLFGYRIEDKKVFIHEENANAVKKCFEMYIKGKSIKAIIDWLNERGFKTSKGGKFTHSSFNRFFTNEKYIGIYKYGDEVNYNTYPAIVDKDTFEKAKERKQNKIHYHERKSAKIFYAFTNSLFCGECGGKMIGTSSYNKQGKAHRYYVCCNSKTKHQKTCNTKHYKKKDIEFPVLSLFPAIILNDDYLNNLINFIVERNKTGINAERIKQVEKQIKKIDKDIEKCYLLFKKAGDNDIIINKISQEIKDLDILKKDYEKELVKYRTLDRAKNINKKELRQVFKNFLSHIYEDEKDIKTFVEDHINAIYVFNKQIVIYYKYNIKDKSVTFEDVKKDLKNKNTKADVISTSKNTVKNISENSMLYEYYVKDEKATNDLLDEIFEERKEFLYSAKKVKKPNPRFLTEDEDNSGQGGNSNQGGNNGASGNSNNGNIMSAGSINKGKAILNNLHNFVGENNTAGHQRQTSASFELIFTDKALGIMVSIR